MGRRKGKETNNPEAKGMLESLSAMASNFLNLFNELCFAPPCAKTLELFMNKAETANYRFCKSAMLKRSKTTAMELVKFARCG